MIHSKLQEPTLILFFSKNSTTSENVTQYFPRLYTCTEKTITLLPGDGGGGAVSVGVGVAFTAAASVWRCLSFTLF